MASPPHRIFYTVIYRVYNIFSGVSVPGASVLGYSLPPIEFSTLSSIEYNNNLLYTRSFCPRVWPPPYKIFYTVTYILLKNFCTRSFCPRIWPPPYRIFFTVIYRVYYNLFSGVSAPGASVLGYGLPPIEFSSLSSIEYIISSQEFLELLS